jgi:predicted metal-dependent phosphoesterase TrpH
MVAPILLKGAGWAPVEWIGYNFRLEMEWFLNFLKRWSAHLVLLPLVLAPWAVAPQVGEGTPANLVLTGDVKGEQHQTYFEVPFTVPGGVHRISVDFHYTGKDQRATLDLGIADPERFRGASGGNKSHFTISETDATPSYLPGAIPAGRWRLLIAVPNMRPTVVSHYEADIRFNARAEDSSFTAQPLAVGTRWYRGDLHMHTAHSDGSCKSQSGRQVPCPLFLTVEAAAERSLDFIAITDHNTDSQYDQMRELQPFFDHLLLIPGREMTTFHGHFNVFGVTQFMEWRISKGGLDLNAVLRDARSKGGIASVNHAEAPEGEVCMGCRWTPAESPDMSLFSAVEVINYGKVMLSSAKYWDSELRAGHRLAAVGGSDNHNATTPPGDAAAIGWPVTGVEADELSVGAILDGIRAGRTFIDLTASRDKMLDFAAEADGVSVKMGGTLHAAAGDTISVRVRTIATEGSIVHLLLDGEEPIPPVPVGATSATATATFTAAAGRHWLRLVVRDPRGADELISSPLYINFPPE